MNLIEGLKITKAFLVQRQEKSLKKRFFSMFSACRENDTSIQALQGIDITLPEGEILGIIGPNGAGKTTLLKVINGIFSPDSGTLKTSGRIFSLMRLGLNFFPQLSGRDNLRTFAYLHRIPLAALEDRWAEIMNKCQLHEHIDLPLKCYSSGMQVRLAFAALTLVEPEILLIDEVYQAGDLHFQQQSLEEIHRLIGKSRGVVFVSHNLHLVKSLCTKAILLDHGQIVRCGPAVDVVNHYLRMNGEMLHGTTI
ncbi:MAG: ATP-binding cassette domain-containing protein [Candidatus Wallbacteria bacterium]|nr:ATP-binding cassette domain-containing protein [Candidatus Wallbacteria bacterium]